MNFYLKHCRECFFKMMVFPGRNYRTKECGHLESRGYLAKLLCKRVVLLCNGAWRCLLEILVWNKLYFTEWLLTELGRTWTSIFRQEIANPNTCRGHQVLQGSEEGWVGIGVNGSCDPSPLANCCQTLQKNCKCFSFFFIRSRKSKFLCTISHFKMLAIN